MRNKNRSRIGLMLINTLPYMLNRYYIKFIYIFLFYYLKAYVMVFI